MFFSCKRKAIQLCTDRRLIYFNQDCCPVVANTHSKIYHIPGGQFYSIMLKKNKGPDNRRCFASLKDAEKAGFRISEK